MAGTPLTAHSQLPGYLDDPLPLQVSLQKKPHASQAGHLFYVLNHLPGRLDQQSPEGLGLGHELAGLRHLPHFGQASQGALLKPVETMKSTVGRLHLFHERDLGPAPAPFPRRNV